MKFINDVRRQRGCQLMYIFEKLSWKSQPLSPHLYLDIQKSVLKGLGLSWPLKFILGPTDIYIFNVSYLVVFKLQMQFINFAAHVIILNEGIKVQLDILRLPYTVGTLMHCTQAPQLMGFQSYCSSEGFCLYYSDFLADGGVF